MDGAEPPSAKAETEGVSLLSLLRVRVVIGRWMMVVMLLTRPLTEAALAAPANGCCPPPTIRV